MDFLSSQRLVSWIEESIPGISEPMYGSLGDVQGLVPRIGVRYPDPIPCLKTPVRRGSLV